MWLQLCCFTASAPSVNYIPCLAPAGRHIWVCDLFYSKEITVLNNLQHSNACTVLWQVWVSLVFMEYFARPRGSPVNSNSLFLMPKRPLWELCILSFRSLGTEKSSSGGAVSTRGGPGTFLFGGKKKRWAVQRQRRRPGELFLREVQRVSSTLQRDEAIQGCHPGRWRR